MVVRLPQRSLKQTAREYEDRRRQGFKATWRDEFAWLTYEPAPADSDSNGAPAGAPAATGSASTKPQAQPLSQYTCSAQYTPCRASYGVSASMRLPDRGLFRKYSKGTFVIGGTNMKRTTLTAHEASDGHSVAVEHERNRIAHPGTSIAEQSIQKMNRAVFNKVDKLFRNAHSIAKNNRPFSDYVWMATLDERKGLILGQTYRNEKACKEFIHSIANMEKDNVMAEMKDVKFITVVSYGSTDVSVSENGSESQGSSSDDGQSILVDMCCLSH